MKYMYHVEPEFALVAPGEHYVGQYPGNPSIAVFKGMDAHEPKMGNSGAYYVWSRQLCDVFLPHIVAKYATKIEIKRRKTISFDLIFMK